MDEADVFPYVAADVAMQAIKDGVARKEMSWKQAYDIAKSDIEHARKTTHFMIDNGLIESPPQKMIDKALKAAIDAVS